MSPARRPKRARPAAPPPRAERATVRVGTRVVPKVSVTSRNAAPRRPTAAPSKAVPYFGVDDGDVAQKAVSTCVTRCWGC